MRTKREIETEFADRPSLHGKRSFFLVGIGGAGMSGIARILKRRGYAVKGTDSTPSPVIDELRKEGIEIQIGHSGESVQVGDALVLTDAIDLSVSPEVTAAKSLGCPLYRRSQVLGWLLEGKKTIAVTGTHGKTTTTGMIGAGLKAAGLDPTIVVGAEVPEFGGAIVEGHGEYAVIEACEAYDSLRDFDPYIAVVTNLELDHVDFHGNWEGLLKTVTDFIAKLPPKSATTIPKGGLVFCSEDHGASAAARSSMDVDTIAYSGRSFDDFASAAGGLPPELALPGHHNRLNAAAALTVARAVGADLNAALKAVTEFHGAERRLQVLKTENPVVIDDYAHHPTEIVASLQAIRERWLPTENFGRLIVVYQPHLYSRTEPLIQEFAEALSTADFVVLTDIYPAREDPIPGVSSFRIAERLTVPCAYVPQRHLLPRHVAALVRPTDVVVGMGAGNISEFAPDFILELGRQERLKSGKLKVAVVCGGDSAEREVSLLSGRAVVQALRLKGHEAFTLDVSELLLKSGSIQALTGRDRPDVCFLAVHGTHAEDGAIQGLLELLHVPYTGSGVQASAVAMDKALTKQILERAGLAVPRGALLTTPQMDVRLDGPPPVNGYVVKPNAQGSTVGLTFVRDARDLPSAVAKAFQYGKEVLVEEWIQGVEISVPVLDDRALPVVEIVPNSGSYDFASKYTPGATNEICPARLSEAQTAKAKEMAVKAHNALGCRGCTRTDMIVTEDKIVCLEVNTLPGMTATSLVPNSAKADGQQFEDLCDWMVKDAVKTAQT